MATGCDGDTLNFLEHFLVFYKIIKSTLFEIEYFMDTDNSVNDK